MKCHLKVSEDIRLVRFVYIFSINRYGERSAFRNIFVRSWRPFKFNMKNKRGRAQSSQKVLDGLPVHVVLHKRGSV